MHMWIRWSVYGNWDDHARSETQQTIAVRHLTCTGAQQAERERTRVLSTERAGATHRPIYDFSECRKTAHHVGDSLLRMLRPGATHATLGYVMYWIHARLC